MVQESKEIRHICGKSCESELMECRIFVYFLGSILGAVHGPNVPMIKSNVFKFLNQELAVEEGDAIRENVALESLIRGRFDIIK